MTVEAMMLRPYDYLLDPVDLFDAALAELRPFRVISPADPAAAFVVEDGTIRLRPNQNAHAPLNDPQGSFGGLVLPRGVAVWRDHLFFADPTRARVLWRPPNRTIRPVPALVASPEPVVSPAPEPEPQPQPPDCSLPAAPRRAARELVRPVGLAISSRDDLIIVDAALGRLLLLALPGFVLRRIIVQPPCDGEAWRPVDVAVGPRGRLFVADAAGRVWRLDRQGRPDANYVGALPPGATPRRVAVDGDGRAYVLVDITDETSPAVFVLDRFGRLVTEGEPSAPRRLISIDDPPEPGAPPLRELLGPAAIVLEGREIRLRTTGKEACCAEPSLPSGAVDDIPPLTVRDDGRLDLPLIDPPYATYVPPPLTFAQVATLIIELDSRRFANPWHRLALELEPIDRTGVQLYSQTSDQPRPAAALGEVGGAGWATAPVNTGEWLVQSPPGQFLYLGVRLSGPGDRSPRLGPLYVYRERNSSLGFLPATFQADPAGRHALDRLLSLFDTLYAELEMSIDEFAFLLDPDSGHPAFVHAFLPWLASWFGLLLEASWDEAQRRAFVREVMWLYRRQGTPAGIARLVQLHAGLARPPRVIEHFPAYRDMDELPPGSTAARLRQWLLASGIESHEDGTLKHQEPRHHFSLFLPGVALDDPDRLAALHRLLLAYIPAHTHYSLRRLPNHGFRLPQQQSMNVWTPGVVVGVDTVVGSPRDWRAGPDLTPPHHLGVLTVLPAADRPQAVYRVGEWPLTSDH